MRGFIFLFLFLSAHSVWSQAGRVEKSDRIARLIDRFEIKYGYFEGHTGIYPLYRNEVYNYVASLDSLGLSPKETYDRELILNSYQEFGEKIEREPVSFIKNFYRNKTHFYEFQKKNLYLSVDPILFLQAGLENGTSHQLRNTRGVEFQGQLGDRIYFRSQVFENQSTFLEYHERTIRRFRAIPGNAFFKNFDFNLNTDAFDYLNARAFAGLKVNEFLNLEIGHGQHFIGTGIRSLILSDYATNKFFTRANTKFWKFRYQNLFAELSPFSARTIPGDELLPKKYMAQHTLSFKATQRLEISLTETVIFNRDQVFELQYLNPIILYRSVEQLLGSPDNVLIGGQVKWNVVDGYQLYGHLMVDEFNLNNIREDFNWWANKFGLQLGAKAVDFLGVSQLDIQTELNLARPYTYTHRTSLEQIDDISPANFSHYSQPLAHPLGANFIEGILDVRYRAGNKLTFHPRVILAVQGVDNVFSPDSTGFNIGANILTPSINRAGSANQRFLQGDRVNVGLAALNVYYEFFPNYFADFNLQYRSSSSVQAEYDLNSLYFGFGIRTNFTELYRDY